jgi:hypothetical protein
MSEQKEKIFADGMVFKLPREGAPDFVKGSVSIMVADFVKFLQANEKVGGWVNIDLKVSKGGKGYAELNTYQSDRPDSLNGVATIEYPTEDINPNDVPF